MGTRQRVASAPLAISGFTDLVLSAFLLPDTCGNFIKKLDDFEEEYQVYGRIVRIKSLLDVVWITAAHVFVNATQLELVMLRDFKENMLSVYYC
ncbi:hypothetical protein Tco_0404979 [Tanacetum coccineum]